MDLDTILGTAPDPSEHAPYFSKYVALAAGGNILKTLETQPSDTQSLLASIGEERGGHRYAPDKWNIREVVGHVNDTERVFAYRALRIARGDQTPLEGFDQDRYVQAGPFGRMSLADLGREFTNVRQATLALLRPLDAEAWMRRAVANKNEVSVRALAFMIAGHLRHHSNILVERYLS